MKKIIEEFENKTGYKLEVKNGKPYRSGSLYLEGCTGITSLPEGLTVGGTDICPLGTPENEAIKRCVQEVFTSDAIYMDVGWQNSDGCRTEFDTAGRYKIPIYTFDGNVIKFE